jgi:hypothetical protein
MVSEQLLKLFGVYLFLAFLFGTGVGIMVSCAVGSFYWGGAAGIFTLGLLWFILIAGYMVAAVIKITARPTP